jgi:Icc-related predicted phosphoesterase
MAECLFVSDLHGRADRYRKLFAAIAAERPAAVFLGGDLLPMVAGPEPQGTFLERVLTGGFRDLRAALGAAYPRVFLILGNDDCRSEEPLVREGEEAGLWRYAHGRRLPLDDWTVYGYACVPPTPFRLKDWERYDVSRFVDPGCYAPEEGWHTTEVAQEELRHGTIARDLEALAGGDDLGQAILLAHSPPYRTRLDRAALDGQRVDHAPLDVHVGSIALRRFIEERQPRLSLHGHVHESARLSGAWRDAIGRTLMLSAAHDGPELALVRFALSDPESATRQLV